MSLGFVDPWPTSNPNLPIQPPVPPTSCPLTFAHPKHTCKAFHGLTAAGTRIGMSLGFVDPWPPSKKPNTPIQAPVPPTSCPLTSAHPKHTCKALHGLPAAGTRIGMSLGFVDPRPTSNPNIAHQSTCAAHLLSIDVFAP